MLPGKIHLHKNRLNNSYNILLFLLPVFVFALLVSVIYNLIKSSSQNQSLVILGDPAFNGETWEYITER